jgi:hypothetical protein
MQLQPYYLLPLFVEQPTWGGSYIANFKQITHPLLKNKRIGQSFELSTDSWVSGQSISAKPFLLADASNLGNPTFVAKPSDAQTLQSVIDQNPRGFLGEKVVDHHGTQMDVLIKFTQAQNNSYQVHVRPHHEFGKWQAKPESWYFLEKGKATLGLNMAENLEAYKARCKEIEAKAMEISDSIKAGKLTLSNGRAQLKSFIDQDHPRRFVNTLDIPQNQLIDLSAGGIHHSWEVDANTPLGNIVYEVQKNVMDDFCTLRSFDQGNIKDDGKVRPITIDDYFSALDTDAVKNDPSQYLQEAETLSDENALITKLFDNHYYKTTAIEWSGKYQGLATQTAGSFHHVWTQSGEDVKVRIKEEIWQVPVGWSLLIPAELRGYALVCDGSAKVLITSH